MTPLVVAWTFVVAGAVEVEAPAGCVDPVEVAAAVDEIGGIDVAESVKVVVTPALDEYELVVDIALTGAPALHREVPLRPRECADVADLVAVLVDGQRRAALEARLLAAKDPAQAFGPDGAPPAKEALPAMDPRTRSSHEQDRLYVDGWSPCQGPAACGGFRLGLSLGPTLPFAGRGAIDVGWDVTDELSVIGAVEGVVIPNVGGRGGGGVGVAYRKQVEIAEVSLRALFGGGWGNGGAKLAGGGQQLPECVTEDGVIIGGGGGTTSTYFLAPTVAFRGRIGYAFVETGAFWNVNLDDYPGAYIAIGVAPFGG